MAEKEKDPLGSSADTHGIDPDNPETWRVHLTPKLESIFKFRGTAIVESDVKRRIYQDDRKYFAVRFWLETRRFQKSQFIFWAVSLIAAGVLFVALMIFFGPRN